MTQNEAGQQVVAEIERRQSWPRRHWNRVPRGHRRPAVKQAMAADAGRQAARDAEPLL